MNSISSLWHYWQTRIQQKTVPHALLIKSLSDSDAFAFATTLVKLVLCESPSACGQCRACHLLEIGNHPDYKIIQPEKAGQLIKIDSIRESIGFVQQTALQGGYRVIQIYPAQAMHHYAANALLKVLEEPPPQTLFLLLEGPGPALLKTIISRCQKVVLPTPDITPVHPATASEIQCIYTGFLQLHAPDADPIAIAKEWQEIASLTMLNCLLLLLQECARLMVTQGQAPLHQETYRSALLALIPHIQIAQLYELIDHIRFVYQKVAAGIPLNQTYLTEEILIRWMRYVSG